MKGKTPPSNRACGFPAHGLPAVSRVAALRSPRVLDGPTQADQPLGLEEVALRRRLLPCPALPSRAQGITRQRAPVMGPRPPITAGPSRPPRITTRRPRSSESIARSTQARGEALRGEDDEARAVGADAGVERGPPLE